MSYMPARYFTLSHEPCDQARRVLDSLGLIQPDEYRGGSWTRVLAGTSETLPSTETGPGLVNWLV
jgi:hypothetical protein